MSILSEFKSFAIRGNAVDLAVGIIVGGAFGKIITSFVNDVIMPPVGLLLGGVNFADKAWVLKEAVGDAPAVLLKYGLFVNVVIDFLLVALIIFLIVKQLNRFSPATPPPPVTTKKCTLCLSVIDVNAKKCAFCTSSI